MSILDSSTEFTGGLATKQALYRLGKDVQTYLDDIEPQMHDTQSWKYVIRQAFSNRSVHSTFRWISIILVSMSIVTYLFAFKYGHFTSQLPLMVESIILILVLLLNCSIIFWNSKSRHLELYNKARKLSEKILSCTNNDELIERWASGKFYPNLNTPTSPCITLQWTFRDGKLVNLPAALLVTGDVILLNPGRTVPAKCRRIDKVVRRPKKLSDYNLDMHQDSANETSNTYSYVFDDTIKDCSFLRGDIFAPKVENAPESFTIPRLRKAIKPCKFLILETPYIQDLKATVSIHTHRRSSTAFEKELRLIFVRYLEYLLVPGICILVLSFSIIHYCYVEFTGSHSDTGAATIVLIFLRPVMAIIPLLPLALPILWLVLNVYGLIKMNNIYENFCKNENKLKTNHENEYRKSSDDYDTENEKLFQSNGINHQNMNGKCNKDYFLEEIDPERLSCSIPRAKLTLRKIMKELFSFLYNDNGFLWRTANLLHVFGSITAFCCVDKKGILSWPNPTADKVFFLTAPNQNEMKVTNEHNDENNDSDNEHRENDDGKRNSLISTQSRAECVQLNITHDRHNAYGLQFDDLFWNQYMANLKPLGLAILLNTCNEATQEECVQFSDHIACESMCNEVAVPVINKRCLCELARQIGFKSSAVRGYEYCYQVAMFRHIRPEVIQKGKLAKSLNFPRLKMPFPNMTCAVIKDSFANTAQLFSHGTGDLVLDACAEYWNGQNLVLLTDYERKKILDFYQRSSLTSYCCAFAYLPLTNESGQQHISNSPYLNEYYIELPPDSSHLFPFQRSLDANIRGLAIDTHHLSSHTASHMEATYISQTDSAMYLNPNLKSMGHHLSSDSLVKPIHHNQSSCDNDVHCDGDSSRNSATKVRSKSFSLDSDKIEQTVKNVTNEVFIGMTTLQYQACSDFVRIIELLDAACIRFVHFSKENELRSRVFSEKMGIESGWNCHISLLNDLDNDGSSTDNVHQAPSRKNTTRRPSLSSLSSSDSSDSAGRLKSQEMIKLQRRRKQNSFSMSSERSESVISNMRSYRNKDNRSSSKNSNPNRNMSPSPSRVTTTSTMTDHSAPIAFDMSNRAKLPKGIDNIRPHIENVDNVPLLVSLFTDCTPEATKEMIEIMQENEEVVCVIGSMANESNIQIFLQADASIGIDPMYPHMCITSPIFPSDQLSFEQLPDNFLSPTDLSNLLIALPCSLTMSRQNAIIFYQLIMIARDYTMRMRNIFQFFLSSCLSLSLAQMITSLVFLPPLLSPGIVLWLSLIVIPILSVSLMSAQIDSNVMNVATGKKLHLNKETIVYFFLCYIIKFTPSILICIIMFAIIIGTSCGQTNVGSLTFGPCWMFSDVKANGDIRTDIMWSSHLLIGQTISSFFFVVYLVIISMGFVHRNHLLWQRNPLRNLCWISTSILLLICHICVCIIEILIYVPEAEIIINFVQSIPIYIWIIGSIWPFLLITINLYTKRREIRMFSRQQRRARLEFGTKLGMNSPF